MKFIARSRLAVACAVAGLAAGAPVGSAHAQCASAHTATLVPNDAMSSDLVGISALAMNGSADRVLFGSVDHSHLGSDRGAAWVVSNPGTAFAQTVEIMPAVTWDGAWFGKALAMNGAGDSFVAGAPEMSTVYAFRFDGTNWIEEWSTTSAQGWDWFGASVAMNDAGELIVVGAPRRLIPPNTYFYYGAVDIYRRQANTWVLEKTLARTTEYAFGSTVAISGDGNLLAVRSLAHQVSGSVVLHDQDGGAWNEVATLSETINSGSGSFAPAIDVDATGQTVVAGSPLDWRMGYMSGAVLVFRKSASGWFLEGEMLLPTQGVGFQLGASVSVNAAGDRVVAGAPGYVSNGNMIGAVYEYARVNSAWQQVGVYTSPNPDKFAGFGQRVAVSATGRRWVASEPGTDWNIIDGGAIHVFESPCTQPAVYCTAQSNSLGCVARMAWEGPPSASMPGAFKLGLSNTRNRRSGLLFYGTTGPAAIPWYGGTLCVQPPLRRTPLQDSGGNPLPADDCSGSFSFDFNAWYGGDPALYPGVHVFAQYLSRDPSPTSQVNLSDALEFYVEP